MRTTNRVVAIAGAASVLAGLMSTAGTATADHPARRGVCKGVKDCYVMGHVDVTGDHKRDWVGAVNHNGRKTKLGKVTIRVLSKGKIHKKRLKVRHWKGNVFHGIARIDGRRGAELVVGANRRRYKHHDAGGGSTVTHSKAFHVIAMRHGKLKPIKAPGKKTRMWWLTPPGGVASGDANAPDSSRSHRRGYFRHHGHGRARIVRKDYTCVGLAGCHATRVKYVWRHGHWAKKSKKRADSHLKGGWHVKGLQRW